MDRRYWRDPKGTPVERLGPILWMGLSMRVSYGGCDRGGKVVRAGTRDVTAEKKRPLDQPDGGRDQRTA